MGGARSAAWAKYGENGGRAGGEGVLLKNNVLLCSQPPATHLGRESDEKNPRLTKNLLHRRRLSPWMLICLVLVNFLTFSGLRLGCHFCHNFGDFELYIFQLR